MDKHVFLAGASGVIGRRLVPLLIRNGFVVTGTTRSHDRATLLKTLGANPVIVDVFNAEVLMRAVTTARPDVVIHQLTDLSALSDPGTMEEALRRNALIRRIGTANLVAAALAAHVSRFIAQSIAWVYAPGPTPHVESDPLDLGAAPPRSVTIEGVAALEGAVLSDPRLEGIVLRYGKLYGPGTGDEHPADRQLSVHVDAAAQASLLAITKGRRGTYNISEPDIAVTCEKARRELGWNARFRLAQAEPGHTR